LLNEKINIMAPPLSPIPPGRQRLAAVLSFAAPGLGQLYAGKPYQALFIHLGWLALLAVCVLLAFSSFTAALTAGTLALLWSLGAAAHAANVAGPPPRRPYLAWYVLLALGCLGNGATELALLSRLALR
jgi:hypothetical protein